MSTFDSDDLEVTGYFMPEDSQYRLTKLRDYAQFLSHLAQPRTADEEQEWWGPEIRASEVAICMELLAEQVGLVLDKLSCPSKRGERAAAGEADAEAAACAEAAAPDIAEPVMDAAGNRYLFGLTLDQFD